MISQASQYKRYDSTAGSEYIFEYMKTHCAQTTSDVTIQCSDGAVRAHQLVLASISPMLCQELCWNQSNVDEARTIIMPEITIDKMSKYLEAVYSCEDLFSFQDINTIIGFKFASGDTGDRLHNTTTSLPLDERPYHATNLVDTEMKVEADSEEENCVGTFIERHENCAVGEGKLKVESVIMSDERWKVESIVSRYDNEDNGILEAAPSKKREYGRRSKVWQHFSVDPSDPTQCVCRVCGGTISYRSGGYGYTSGGQTIFLTA